MSILDFSQPLFWHLFINIAPIFEFHHTYLRFRFNIISEKNIFLVLKKANSVEYLFKWLHRLQSISFSEKMFYFISIITQLMPNHSRKVQIFMYFIQSLENLVELKQSEQTLRGSIPLDLFWNANKFLYILYI